MICPKCGFEQEARLDCRKCGIVFNKYLALYPSSQSPVAKSDADLLVQEFPDLQQKLRELDARFVEIEFEKAERNRLRTDLKNLGQELRQDQERMSVRLQQIEGRLAGLPNDPELKIDEQMQQILPKCAACESKTTKLMDSFSLTVNQLSDLWETTNRNSHQISELHDVVTALKNEFLEMREQLALIQQTLNREEPQTIDDDNIHAIRKNLDELGQFISSLSRKQ